MEVSISLFLLSILLTGLFSFLKDLPKADHIIREKKQEIHEINFLQMRLQQTLSKCLFEFEGEFLFEFNSLKKQLSYVLDLGIDRDPDFSGPVRAIFCLDSENNLKIDYFSIQSPSKKRSEILVKNVEEIDFYFYDALCQKWTKNKINKENILPKMLKVALYKNSHKIDFAYIFAQNEPIIIKS